jgi:AcrR family transcriptional regulator
MSSRRREPAADEAASRIDRRRELALLKGSRAYQERRREIAKVAAQVFNKRGYRGASMGAVAAALGASRASLYYYIPSKQELFDLLVREAVENNVTTAEEIRASDLPAAQKLRTLLIALMRSSAATYPLFYLYVRENLSHVESKRSEWAREMRQLNRRYEEIIIAIIQSGINEGTLRPIASARIIAYGIMGMIGWTNRWFDPTRSPESAEAIGATFAEMALSGIKV